MPSIRINKFKKPRVLSSKIPASKTNLSIKKPKYAKITGALFVSLFGK